jgi:hypothetical protein
MKPVDPINSQDASDSDEAVAVICYDGKSLAPGIAKASDGDMEAVLHQRVAKSLLKAQ